MTASIHLVTSNQRNMRGRKLSRDQKLLGIVTLVFLLQLLYFWGGFGFGFAAGDGRFSILDAEIRSLERKRDGMLASMVDLERQKHRMELKLEKLEYQVKELVPLRVERRNSPTIFFITPTAPRPTQKADLTRLAQTLAHINNLQWVVVEDTELPSPFIDELVQRLKLNAVHLCERTPADKRPREKDPSWKLPKGVEQRNAALRWIRTNFATWTKGVVYFGDDDNTYDWRLFIEMRSIKRIGVWPVGIVGGLLAETPITSLDGKITGFNSLWKPTRPFPMDMAGFTVNITLVLEHGNTFFTYDSPRGYQESHFLEGLNLTRADLEPKALACTKVYVWHTRTERAKLAAGELSKFTDASKLSGAELDAIH